METRAFDIGMIGQVLPQLLAYLDVTLLVGFVSITLGSLLGGTVIIETIFNWPGIGSLIMGAISNRDYPVIQAIVVWMALAFFLVNLLADLSYRYFNPKIKDL